MRAYPEESGIWKVQPGGNITDVVEKRDNPGRCKSDPDPGEVRSRKAWCGLVAKRMEN